VRPGSLSPMLAAAASISNKSEPLDPLSHPNFSVEASIGGRLPGRTSRHFWGNNARGVACTTDDRPKQILGTI
jgi:hypothetical protein